MSLPALSAAISAFNAALVATGNLDTVTLPKMVPLKAAGQALNTAFEDAIRATDVLIINDPLAGDPLGYGATNIHSTLDALYQQTAIADAAAYYGRAVANIVNSAG